MVQDKKTPTVFCMAIVETLAQAAIIAACVICIKSCVVNKIIIQQKNVDTISANDNAIWKQFHSIKTKRK